MTAIHILRAGPGATVQDAGRFGALRHGISASGPMDRGAFRRAGAALGQAGGEAIEIARAGLDFTLLDGTAQAAFDGGRFALRINGVTAAWPTVVDLASGDRVEITPGPAGNYGYVRFDQAIEVPRVIGSRATNSIAGLGGLNGRSLRAGDELHLSPATAIEADPAPRREEAPDAPVRIVWGLHAELFSARLRQAFLAARFTITPRLDRMGVRLDADGLFASAPILSLVSDAVVPGDVQILGDGTPIVLMRDHQPTGGYPRIATVISADLDRFAQLRPGATLAFAAVTLQKAHELFRASQHP